MGKKESNTHNQDMHLLRIPEQLYEQMRVHVTEEYPIEACGILGGTKVGQTILANTLFPMKNILNSQVRFRMDPFQQFQVFNNIETSNLELIAIYHSHPTGLATPSMIDIEEAFYPDAAFLIWSFQTKGWKLLGFRIRDGEYREILIELTR